MGQQELGAVKDSKISRRLGRILFLIPVIVALVLVIVAVISTANPNGTISIRAESSGRYYSPISLAVSATVNGITQKTPFNLSLPQGEYTIQFSPLTGYEPPSQVQATVIHGGVAYATAIYNPVVRVISDLGGVFNATSVQAIRSVTPVIWVNEKGSYFVINVTPIGRIIIPPFQNFTYVFPDAGSFGYNTLSGNSSGTVQVK
jgi:hypothetical protein